MKILHIINPVNIGPSSDLFTAQPVTFKSMERARAHASSELEIRFEACGYEEDRSVCPAYMDAFHLLERSVLDIGTFKKQRKLPLIADILGSVDADVDYVIYTNVDIAVLPWFYSIVAQRISKGIDAFIINRRTISTDFTKPDELDSMYAQAGEIHPGLDCFVMSKSVLEKLVLEDVCIGATFIGKALEANLMTHAQHFELYKEDHLTFHLGDDRAWKSAELSDFELHNKREFKKLLDNLLEVAIKEGKMEAVAKIKKHLYKHFEWNEDGANPFLNIKPVSKPSLKERVKRSIGALMGKY